VLSVYRDDGWDTDTSSICSLPHDPPHPRSQASTSSSSHIRRGTLLPLYPTLGGQLYAISREYGLPSIGGLSIYLCDDGEGNLGPRVGDAAWSALWNRFFDESADDLYVDITSPAPIQRFPSAEQDRRFSETSSSEMQSPYADQPSSLRRETESYEDGFLSEQQRRPSSSLRRTFAANGYHTPSPRNPKIQRTTSRASLRVNTPVSAQARLPIVGRIEWAVDKNRAAWWSNWIGEADVSSERSGSSVVTSQFAGGSARKGPARRSMHLTTSLPRPRTFSSIQGNVLQKGATKAQEAQQDQDEDGNGNVGAFDQGYAASREVANATDKSASAMSSPQASNMNLQSMGYEPIDDDGDHGSQQMTPLEESFDDALKASGMPGPSHSDDMNGGTTSYEGQSYAGYSALLGVDDETRAQDALSSMTEKEEPSFQTRPLRLVSAANKQREVTSNAVEIEHHFNANLLTDADDDNWKVMREEDNGRNRAVLSHSISARSLGEQKELSAVHEWIAKTQSPQSRRAELDLGDTDEEENLLPPEDDVGDVLGLWAEKAREVHAMISPTVMQSNRTSTASTNKMEHQRGVTNQRNSGRISSTSSKQSPKVSPQVKQSPLQQTLAKMADLPEETPILDPPTFSKASLLSPIALDSSPATFAGPSAKLGSLLGTIRSTLGPNDEQAYPLSRQSTLDSLPMKGGERSNLSRSNTLSSPRLELPPHSPGGASQHSSSTDVSDTLLDMERALALLSPAVSNKNQSPAMGTSTAESSYDTGILTSAVRVKMPAMSSKESMAIAKTLSTSVTPSPRWFRNTTPALPRLSQSTSDRAISGPELPINQSHQNTNLRVSPRPASAFASSRHQDPLAAWNFSAPSSASKLAEQVTEDKTADEVKGLLEPSHQEVQLDEKDPQESAEAEEDAETVEEARNEDESATHSVGDVAEDKQTTVSSPHISVAQRSVGDQDSVQICDSPVEEDDRGKYQWLQPGEHLGRQGWSETTGEASRVLTMGDSTLPEDENTDLPAITTSDLPSGVQSASAIGASFSPRSGQYATVGVQAERDDASRTDSLFSLVSDEALGSEASRLMDSHGEEEGAEEDRVEERKEIIAPKSDTLQTPTFDASTPQMSGGRPRLGHSGNSSVDIAPSIQRLIRGHSFAESSEASSTNANSPYVETERLVQGPAIHDFDWSRFGIKTVQEEEVGSNGEDKTIEQPQQHQSEEIATVEEEGITTRGATTNESSFDDGEDWSQSGSEYDATDSPATRASRLSGYSHRNGAGISDAGGRTPTFFYDSHLTDEESASRRASRRMSGARRSSAASRKSVRLSRAPLRSVYVNNGLGVGQVPAQSATLSSGPDYHETLSVFGGSFGETSFDSNRHDVVSLAGETLEGLDNAMPQGFEHVSPSSRDLAIMESANEDGDFGPKKSQEPLVGDAPMGTPSTPPKYKMTLDSLRRSTAASPRSNDNGVAPSLRRSMGSIKEDRRGSSDYIRRASASATSPGRSSSTIQPSSLPSPRRFKGAMLRLGAIASPNQRFRALPPSPNLPAKKVTGVEGPISPGFLSNGMPHTNPMVSPQTTFSSVDSIAITDGITSSDSPDRNTFPSPYRSHSPLSQ
jgi:hypothetical protein